MGDDGEFFAEAAAPIAYDLRDLLPDLDVDLVVYENIDLGAAAAAAAGVPSIGVAITRSLDPHIRDMLDGRSLEELQARFGEVPRPDDRLVDTYPPSAQRREFVDDPRRVPMRAVPWSEPSLPLPPWGGTRERRLGTGIALDTTNPDLIAKAVHTLLEDAAYVQAAHAVRHEIMEMPHPATVIGDLTAQ